VPRHIYYLNVREYRRCNQNRTIQRNWQHWVHKTKKNKTQHNPEKLATYRVHKTKANKTQHNPEKLATLGTQDEEKQNKNTTPLYANKHK
jgi:monoamine oxidase